VNCREVQHQLFADRDGALEETQRAALDGHVAQCADCRRIRDDLVFAFATWQTEQSRVVVPDAEREWHAVRRRIRGGATVGSPPRRASRSWLGWLAVPVGAAAALALTLSITRQTPAPMVHAKPATQTARANSIQVPGNSASTMVFVDDKSGWLIVWATDNPKSG
jgi:hypothetical protein